MLPGVVRKNSTEFLVEFEVNVPDGTSAAEVKERQDAEASAAARLANEGHLVRVWKQPVPNGETKVLGLYRADNETQLDSLLGALPLSKWMDVRTSTQIETAAPDLDWLNRGVFISVAGRQAAGVIYETYLVE
jgi:muconolactone D-isomerase